MSLYEQTGCEQVQMYEIRFQGTRHKNQREVPQKRKNIQDDSHNLGTCTVFVFGYVCVRFCFKFRVILETHDYHQLTGSLFFTSRLFPGGGAQGRLLSGPLAEVLKRKQRE